MELTRKWILKVFFLICTLRVAQNADTTTKSDLEIPDGHPMMFVCTLNDTTITNSDSSFRKSLSFRKNNQTLPKKDLFILLIPLGVAMIIDRPEKGSNDLYSCYYKEKLVNSKRISVGVPPQDVEDFQCEGYNFENFSCSWTAPLNYVKTDYELTYFEDLRRTSSPEKCPNLIESGEKNTKNHRLSCYWDQFTKPAYFPLPSVFDFTLSMRNCFGSKNNTFYIRHHRHIVSGPPENLTVSNGTFSSIFLHWNVTHSMNLNPFGLYHRVLYSCGDYKRPKFYQAALIVDQIHEERIDFNLTITRNPNTICEIRVSMRIAVPFTNDEKWWSKNSSIIIYGNTYRAVGNPAYF